MYRKQRGLKRQVSKRILVLTEGKTEWRYFENYKTKNLSGLEVKIGQKLPEPTNSPLGLVDRAIKKKDTAISEMNPFHSIWVVFDRDQHSDLSKAFELAAQNNIFVAFSSICFEYWYFLHFKVEPQKFKTCESLIEQLTPQHLPFNPKKRDCFELLLSNRDNAIVNAKSIRKKYSSGIRSKMNPSDCKFDPYTNVDKLVEFLLNTDIEIDLSSLYI